MRSFIHKRSLVNTIVAASLVLGLAGCGSDKHNEHGLIGEMDLGKIDSNELVSLVVGYYPGDVAAKVGAKMKLTGNPGGKKITLQPSPKNTIAEESASAAKSVGRAICGRQDLEERERDILAAYRKDCLAKGTDLNAKTINTTYTNLREGETTKVYCMMTYKSDIVVQKMHSNADTSSVIVLAEQDSSGKPVITKEEALEIDKYFGIKNDYDVNGTPIGERVRKTFGSEWRKDGGIDGTDKLVVIVFSDKTIGQVYGFMTYVDCLPSTQKTNSNMGEIIYLNGSKKGVDLYSTLAHEFQHLCNFNQKYVHDGNISEGSSVLESNNVTEGFSVLAEEETGFGLEINKGGETRPGNYFIGQTVNSYCADPQSFSSDSWGNSTGDYGKAYLTMRYIADTFGLNCINKIATSSGVGIANVEACTGRSYNSLAEGMTVASLGIDKLPKDFCFNKLILNEDYLLQKDADSPAETVRVDCLNGDKCRASDFSMLEGELDPNTSAVVYVHGEGGNFRFGYDLPHDYTLSAIVSRDDVYERMKVAR